MNNRRLGDFYAPALEVLPGVLFLFLAFSFKCASPQAAVKQVLFLPVAGALFYVTATVGTWMAIRVEDPARDVNWLLVRLDPARVITDPVQKERYLGGVVRMLFLVKTVVLAVLLVAQIRACLPNS